MSFRLDQVFHEVDEKLASSLIGRGPFDQGFFVPEKRAFFPYEVDVKIQEIISAMDLNEVQQLKTGILNTTPLSFEKTIRCIQQTRKSRDCSTEGHVSRFLRNLTEKEIHQVAQVRFSEDPSIKKIAELIHSGANYFEIVQENRFGPYAFAAFAQKLISREQLTSLLIHWAARHQFGGSCRTYSFFDKENCDQFLRPALYKLSDNELERLYSLMQGQEKSEQIFSVIHCDESTIGRRALAFAEALNTLFPLFQFQRDPEFDHVLIVIPSFSLLQAYLNAVFGRDAIILEPEIRTTNWENIERDFIQDRRPLLVPFPSIENTVDVDGHVGVGIYLAMLHDFYHAVRLSTVPTEYRRGVVRHIHLLRHYIDLSNLHSGLPLLCAYSQEGVVTYPKLSQEEIEQTKSDIEELLDGEATSLVYYKRWLRNQNGVFVQKPCFAAPFNSDDVLSRTLPDKFQTDAFIYDSVFHEKEWKQLGIDVRLEKSTWDFGDTGHFPNQSAILHRYAGFKKLLKFV